MRTDKIKRTRKWHKKLTIAELRHVHESTTSGTMAEIKCNATAIRQWKLEQEQRGEQYAGICWDCLSIARKLGL